MFTFSQAAARDVENILDRSVKEFGEVQTERYFLSLKKCLDLLTSNPAMGTSAADIKPSYYRFPHRSHVIFYTISNKDIFIIRILHKSMDIENYVD